MKRSAERIGLNLSVEHYLELVRLVYLGEWMVNSQHDGEYEDHQAVLALQSVLALAGSHLPEVVGHDEETGRFFVRQLLASKFEDDYISDYDEHVFWGELASRLAERDLAKRLGKDESELDFEKLAAQLRPLREHYEEELDKHGLDHFELK